MNMKAIAATVVLVIMGIAVIFAIKLFSLTLPLNIIIGGGMILGGVALGPIIWIFDIFRWAPEAFVFEECRKKEIPCILNEDIGSGRATVFPGKKENEKSPVFKSDTEGDIKVDPGFLHGTRPIALGNGLYIHHYATAQYTPLTTVNTLGLMTVRKIARENFPELAFMSDKEIAAFGKMDRSDLPYNVGVLIGKYKPEYEDGSLVESEDMKNVIIEFQEILKKTAIDISVPCAHDAAFAMNPVTHSSQDLADMISIIRMLADLAWKKLVNIMTYVICGLLVMIGGAVAVYIVAQIG